MVVSLLLLTPLSAIFATPEIYRATMTAVVLALVL